MADETKPCVSCTKVLPAEAAFCTDCGAPQPTHAAVDGGSLAFELAEAGAHPSSSSPESEPIVSEPSSSEPVDSDLMEIELDLEAVDEEPALAASGPAGEAAPDEEDDDEAAQTGHTVRMKMSDVVQAWNDDAGVDEEHPPAPTGLADTSGLPKGFVIALLASLAVMALILYFLA